MPRKLNIEKWQEQVDRRKEILTTSEDQLSELECLVEQSP